MDLDFVSFCALIGSIVIILILVSLYLSKAKKTARSGVVVLHQIKRIPGTIFSLSPPCLKLETFLRMTKIPYECDFGYKMSSKGKMPWIEYNGKEVADSNFCIEFLSKEFGVDVDDHLTVEQKAMARAILVMLEENTYWTVAYTRWCDENWYQRYSRLMLGEFPFPLINMLSWYGQRIIKNYVHGHGIGRHTKEEIYGIAERDLRAVSACLGEKKFLFGEKPCLADAALFAIVYNFMFPYPDCPQGKLILTQLKNLEDHSTRMKEMFYPDWDEATVVKEKSA